MYNTNISSKILMYYGKDLYRNKKKITGKLHFTDILK